MLQADDYYEMAKEILQKNREGRCLWGAYENNAKRYIMLAEECQQQEKESPLLLPPKLHTLYDRLRQIVPEQRSRPMRQAYLTGALQRNLEKDLDLTMWDEEHLDESERIYLQKHREIPDDLSREATTGEAERDRPPEPHESSTVQLQLAGEQNSASNRATGQDDIFRGMFESTEKLPDTPAARMSAAFDELETML